MTKKKLPNPEKDAPTAGTVEASSANPPNPIERTNKVNSNIPQHSTLSLVIGGVAVRQLDGLFCLNDLHRSSGGEDRHQPAKFVRLDQTQALIAELGNSPDLDTLGESKRTDLHLFTIQGRNGGTYACREIIVDYAAWISPAFHLKVLRVFLATARPEVMKARIVRDRQIGRCQSLLRDIERSDSKFCRDGLIALAGAAFVDLGVPMPPLSGLRLLQLPLVTEGGTV